MDDSNGIHTVRLKETPFHSRQQCPKIRNISSRAPARNSAEVPILDVLSKFQASGIKTKLVLREVRSPRWFPDLNEEDLAALYSRSRKNIVDSVIKYSRKQY